MTDPVARLHEALVEELQRRGHPADRPVSVNEVRSELVPYAAVRSRLGVELNADYEHALLRLLAGVGGFVRLEPEEARRELLRELDAPYPDVGLYRKFGASPVWVAMEPGAAGVQGMDRPALRLHRDAPAHPAGDGPGDDDHATAGRAGDPSPGVTPDPPAAPGDVGPDTPADDPDALWIDPDADGGAGVRPAPRVPERSCHACARPLPAGRRVRFCPLCGEQQRLERCPRCEADVESGWRFCIRCGLGLGPPS